MDSCVHVTPPSDTAPVVCVGGVVPDTPAPPAPTTTDEKTKMPAEGMGLGLFIANVLLEKTNGKLKFSNVKQLGDNGKKRIKGAKVEILWKRSSIEVLQLDKRAKVKENPSNVS